MPIFGAPSDTSLQVLAIATLFRPKLCFALANYLINGCGKVDFSQTSADAIAESEPAEVAAAGGTPI